MKSKRLVIDPSKLYGREKEVDQLVASWRRCCEERKQELVVLRGKPGTGKTAVATALRDLISRETPRQNGVFVAGRYTETAVNEPYAVFVTALSQFVDQFFHAADQAEIERCCSVVKDAVGEDAGLLTSVIPALERILGGGGNNSMTSKGSGTADLYRFQLAFANLMAVLTTVAPVVMFLDDLQWADTASLELLRNLMRSQPMALFLIGSYRHWMSSKDIFDTAECLLKGLPEQVPDEHDRLGTELVPFQSTLKDLLAESTIRVTLITLNDLRKDDICTLLSDIFEKETADTLELAKVVLLKTKGNACHVIQLILFLADRDLLMCDEKTGEWQWDSAKIDSCLDSIDSILDLIRVPLASVSRVAQEALKIASCLGDEIDDSALNLILQTPPTPLLEESANVGLLVFHSSTGGYSFAHDWIRAAAFDLIPEDERPGFFLKLGRRLWQGSSVTARTDNIVQVTKLMNKGSTVLRGERERMKLAELNLKAGKRSRALSSFPDSGRFLNQGIALLGRNSWKNTYALTLDLYSTAAEVEATNGHFERVLYCIEEVVQNGVQLEDKLRSYETLLRVMPLQGNLGETIATAVGVLKQLGERLPQAASKFAALKELAKVKFALRGKTDECILNLPRMTDTNKIACVRILNLIFFTCYEMKSPYTAIAAFRSILLTLRFGLHDSAGIGFAFYAAMLCGYGVDVHMGFRFGQLAIALAKRDSTRESVPLTHFLVGSLVQHWSHPIRELTFDDLAYANTSGLEMGQMDIALLSRSVILGYMIFAGTSLNVVKVELRDVIGTTRLYRQKKAENSNVLHLQFIHCLQGSAPNPARFTGTALDFDECCKEFLELNQRLNLLALMFYATVVAYYSEDYEYALTMGERVVSLRRKQPAASYFGPLFQFYQGLTLVAVSRLRSCRRCIQEAKQNHKILCKFSRDCPASFRHLQLLLEAEIISVEKNVKVDKIVKTYTDAIEAATREDFTHCVALGCEKYADFLGRSGNVSEAKVYLARAAEMYDKWGAKVKHQVIMQRLLE